jgi:HEAT repeat protein
VLGETKWQAIVQGDKDDIDRLAGTGDSRLVETFIKALEATDRHHRRKSALALGRLGNQEAVEVLGNALLTDDDEIVRASAARALGMIRDDSAVNFLTEALDDSCPQVCKAVKEALEKLRGRGPEPP